jgi:hypothetical protein
MHLDPPLAQLFATLGAGQIPAIDASSGAAQRRESTGGECPMGVTRAYEEYLQKEGYRPLLNDNGMVEFKHEGDVFVLIPDENDAEFFRMFYPSIWTLESETDRSKAIAGAYEVASSVKAAKILIQRDQVHAVVESLLPELEVFPRILERTLGICRVAAHKFGEFMTSAAGGNA